MNPTQLLTHFDRLTEAPDAIPRLRQFILDLAVRGKLVDQDPHDEPASELLKRIQKEKAKIASRIKATLVVGDDKLSFRLRTGWESVRFSQILVELQTGPFGSSLHQSDYQRGGIPVINPASIKNERLVPIESMAVGPATVERLSSFKLRAGDVIMGRRGEMGRCAVVVEEETGWLCGTGSLILRLPKCVSARFFVILIGSPHVREYLAGSAVGSTMQNLNQSILLNLVVGLPPLAEQDRIVAKVDELMALCDRLETAQADRESRRDSLLMASLYRLYQTSDETNCRNYVSFYIRSLPRTTTRPEHIPEIRQSILNLAVRGQLVPQDTSDEPAAELLANIGTQKANAYNVITGRDWVGDILSPVEEAFVAPKGWVWTRIANTVERVTVGYVGPMKDHYVDGGIPFLRSQNVRANLFREEGLISISPQFHRTISKSTLSPGDVVVVRSGNVGTACVIPPSLQEANCSDLVIVKRPLAVLPNYLCFYLNSLASTHIEQGSVGVALTHFNTKSVATMPLPLPPLAEQHRIIAKVEELMALCDQLEAQLTNAQTESRCLLEAVLQEALAPDA